MRVNLSPVTEPSECLSTRIVLPEGGCHPAHCPLEPSSHRLFSFVRNVFFIRRQEANNPDCPTIRNLRCGRGTFTAARQGEASTS